MMILGIGTDLVDCRRLIPFLSEALRHRFLKKFLTNREIAYIEEKVGALLKFNEKKSEEELFAIQLAKSFAAKEAFSKALGTGFQKGMYLKDIEVSRDSLGKPFLEISGKSLEILQGKVDLGKKVHLHLSLSDEYPYAQAQVMIEIC